MSGKRYDPLGPSPGPAHAPAASAGALAGNQCPVPAGSVSGGISADDRQEARKGLLMVIAAAMAWSFGGVIGRALEAADPWTTIAWRSFFAALFLFAFMIRRDGMAGTTRLFRTMGLPGICVALCLAASTIAFVVALGYTSVANILLMQAGVPLIAALLGVVFLRERVDPVTWGAIAAVFFGIFIMVWNSFGAVSSPIGNALALTIALCISLATVITRGYPGVHMTPAVALGMLVGLAVGIAKSSDLSVSLPDLGLLMLFGAFNLGLGMALFVTGARVIPAALAALISTLEPALGPVWVWLVFGEVPATHTLIGGAVVFGALLVHILWQWRKNRRAALLIPH